MNIKDNKAILFEIKSSLLDKLINIRIIVLDLEIDNQCVPFIGVSSPVIGGA